MAILSSPDPGLTLAPSIATSPQDIAFAMKSFAAKSDHLRNTIEDLMGKVDSLSGQVDSLSGQVQVLQDQVGAGSASIASLNHMLAEVVNRERLALAKFTEACGQLEISE